MKCGRVFGCGASGSVQGCVAEGIFSFGARPQPQIGGGQSVGRRGEVPAGLTGLDDCGKVLPGARRRANDWAELSD